MMTVEELFPILAAEQDKELLVKTWDGSSVSHDISDCVKNQIPGHGYVLELEFPKKMTVKNLSDILGAEPDKGLPIKAWDRTGAVRDISDCVKKLFPAQGYVLIIIAPRR